MPSVMVDPTEDLTDDQFDAQQIMDWLETRSLVDAKNLPLPPASAREGELRWAHDNTRAWRLVPPSVLKGYGLTLAGAMSIMDRASGKRFNPNHDEKGKFASAGGSGAAAGGSSPDTSHGGMSDKEFAERQALVERTLAASRNLATDKAYTDANGVWSPERDALQREIAEDLYAKAANVPRDGEAIIAGGLGGAGKTTVLRDFAEIDQSKYLSINPDDIKEELARRDLVPEIPGVELSPLERAPLVHEESSRIAKLVADQAYNDKRNVIWDITMSSKESVQSRIDAMRRAGYDSIHGVFVDIPVETSVERALNRYRSGVDRYEQGDGLGGRYVPPSIIRQQQTSSGTTVNRNVFESKGGAFDAWSIYDNSGHAPKLVAKSRT